MAGGQLEIHPNLDHDKVLRDTCFCYYCLCGGCGVGPYWDPLCGSDSKCLCLRRSSTTAECCASDGLCGGLAVCCCLTDHFQFPPLAGAPMCVLCGMNLSGGSNVSHKDNMFDYGKIFADTCWVYYCCCGGFGCSGIQAGGRPCLGMSQKLCCCRMTMGLEDPVRDGVCYSSVGTECCAWSECQIPPAPNNPTIGLLGWRLNKAASGPAGTANVVGKPSQVEMQ